MPKKEGIRDLFDDIAVKYDRFNHVSSFGADRSWRRKAVREIVDTAQPIQVLDVATGTADFAIAGIFTALVFAAGFAREKGHNPIEWVCDKAIPVRIAALVLMLFAIVLFGAYGSGYAPIDPMYAQF